MLLGIAPCISPELLMVLARKAFAAVMTGETVKYGNVILKKGVVPLA